jgi:hypothetical protein
VPLEPAIEDCINSLNCLKDVIEMIVRAYCRLYATIVLDEKLVPLEGEDETRVVKLLEL